MSTRSSGDWDRAYPWAAQRQREIMERVGSEIVRSRAPTCVVDFDPRSPEAMYIRKRGFNVLRDSYADAEEVARLLEGEGRTGGARALRDAIERGSTATEILMALNWELDRLDQATPPVGVRVRELARALSDTIRTALG